MICSKQFENALIEYKNLGKDDINVYKDNIIVVLDDLNFSLDKLKYSLIKYLTKEGFECFDTEKYLGANPIIKMYDEYFVLKMGFGGSWVMPYQNAILTPLDKDTAL
ncbi:hypothetical protein [Faecalimicrobium sp. JNUCC 81]